MKIFLDDKESKFFLQPFSLTQSVADFRVGIFSIKEKWMRLGDFEIVDENEKPDLKIPANILPNKQNVQSIIDFYAQNSIDSKNDFSLIKFPWDWVNATSSEIKNDIDLLAEKPIKSDVFGKGNLFVGEENIFIKDGVKFNGVTINAENGPVVIDNNVLLMENVSLRGPIYIGKNSVVKMGATIYGGTSIGRDCIVGGEIKNSVIQDFSNKAHHGYLGDSILGRWCNLGAGTSNSNLKNSASEIQIRLTKNGELFKAGNKAGLFMGDYSKSAINTAFNTGTVVGVGCNIFSTALTKKYFDHFSWNDERYKWEKFIAHIQQWKNFKNQEISEEEINTLNKLYKEFAQ